jgi:hypothetical protein
VAEIDFITTAGVLPYIEFWNDHVVYHPLFAMETGKLLAFAKSEWERLAGAIRDGEISYNEGKMLCLCFLALLHSLGSIKQEVPALPSLQIAQSHMHQLFQLVSWKHWLDSKKFRFPMLSLSRLNDNLDFASIGNYLTICEDARKDYEDGVSEAVEKERIAQTHRALQALNSTWVSPVSKKLLWQWIRSHLPAAYQADAASWMGTLFLGSKATVLEFEKADLTWMEEVIVSSVPAGTGVLFAVRNRLTEIMNMWESHYEAWEILPEDPATQVWVNGVQASEPDPGPEPKLESFSTRGAWLQASAKWRLAKARWDKEQAA